jgi:hypothetical protein
MNGTTTILVVILVALVVSLLVYYYSPKIKKAFGIGEQKKRKVTLPLDSIESEPYVVYSFERLLSDYDGPLFQIFNGRTTEDVYAYDKNDEHDRQKYEGRPVTVWYDQSANERHLPFPSSSRYGDSPKAFVYEGGLGLTDHFSLIIPDSAGATSNGKFTVLMTEMDTANVSDGYDMYCNLIKKDCFLIGGDNRSRIFSVNDGSHEDPFDWFSVRYPYINQPDLWCSRVAIYNGETAFFVGNDGNSSKEPVVLKKDTMGANMMLFGYYPMPHVLRSVVIYDTALDDTTAFQLVAKETIPQRLRWMCRQRGLEGPQENVIPKQVSPSESSILITKAIEEIPKQFQSWALSK